MDFGNIFVRHGETAIKIVDWAFLGLFYATLREECTYVATIEISRAQRQYNGKV